MCRKVRQGLAKPSFRNGLIGSIPISSAKYPPTQEYTCVAKFSVAFKTLICYNVCNGGYGMTNFAAQAYNSVGESSSMNYEYFKSKLGCKFNIVGGDLVESEKGLLTVSENYSSNVIYLNKLNKTFNLVVPQKSYIGRVYSLRKLDCVTLFAEWLDDHFGSSWGNMYAKYPTREFYRYYKDGMSLWYDDNGFTKVDTPAHGDCIVYEYKPKAVSHVGICLEGTKILHHLPYKLSCIDSLDSSKIIGVYRYAL